MHNVPAFFRRFVLCVMCKAGGTGQYSIQLFSAWIRCDRTRQRLGAGIQTQAAERSLGPASYKHSKHHLANIQRVFLKLWGAALGGNHIAEQFQSEGSYANHLVQLPDQKLKHVIKGIGQH